MLSMESDNIQKGDILSENPRPPTNSKPPSSRTRPRTEKYRKAFAHVKTHDDLLREHYQELAELLKDSKQPNAHSIRRDHREQTQNLIDDYNCVSGGCSPRGVPISRSLPKSLRSPRSTASSNCSTPRKGSVSRSRRRRSVDSGYTYHSRDSSKHRKHVSFKSDNSSHRTPPSASPNSSPARSPSTTLKSAASLIEQELARRAAKRTARRHNYIQFQYDPESTSNEKREVLQEEKSSERSRSAGKRRERLDRPESARSEGSAESSHRSELQTEVRYGVKVDLEGRMRSDTDLKDTSNSQLREWVKRKDKLIRQSRKQKRAEEKKKKEQYELERQKSEERKKDSKSQVKKWRAKKRAETRLLNKRKLQAAALIDTSTEKRGTPCGDENASLKSPQTKTPSYPQPTKSEKTAKLNRPKSARSNTQLKPDQTETNSKPERSKSAPLSRKPKPSSISLLTIIDNSPDLREKIKQLERDKRLKHRQSYDEWVRVKNQERKDTLKVLRERRQKLEQEISEETARVISEAARRRADQIKSQYNTPPDPDVSQTEPEPEIVQETQTADEKTEPFQWKKDSEKPKNKKPVKLKSCPTPTRNIEDKINPGVENPFRASYKQPKMKRPRSRLEQSGVKGPEFSRFVWELVNDEEDGGRPEPQGADSPANTATEERKLPTKPLNTRKSTQFAEKPTVPETPAPKPETPHPKPSSSSTKPSSKPSTEQTAQSSDTACSVNNEPVIETGKTIFSMTSIEA